MKNSIIKNNIYQLLTPSQKRLISGLPDFLKSDLPILTIKGYAGTGKTFIIKQIACMLSDLKISFSLMAPTGRAAKVLTSKSGLRAYTIHKSIYNVEHMAEIKNSEVSGEESFLYYFKVRDNGENLRHVYIVDEASMISDNYNAGEFFRFGSGKLLSDLLSYTAAGIIKERKIIFVGDDAQLPPVKSRLSPALSKTYLQDNFRITPVQYELTDVVRQDKQSAILRNASRLREAIKKGIYNNLSIDTSEREIISSNNDSVITDYLSCLKRSSHSETVLIAYTNKTVSEYNEMIRSKIFPDQKCIQKGDCIIVVSNNYNKEIEILNGETGIVASISDVAEIRRTPIIKDGNKFYVEITFRDAVIRFRDINNNIKDISCKIIDNLLNSPEPDLTSDELKAMYIDFKIRNSHLKAGTKEFREKLRTDPYFNALRVKFGYSVTCHKAQGGEWQNVIVDFRTNGGKMNESYFRWAYTALTRSKDVLYIVNSPGHNAFTFSSKIENIDEKGLGALSFNSVPNSAGSEISLEGRFEDKPKFLRSFYLAITSVCSKYDAKVSKPEHFEYCERYFISKGKNIFCINAWYNKEGKIKRIEPLISKSIIVDKSLYDTIIDELAHIQGKYIANGIKAETLERENEVRNEFPEEKPWLKNIFEDLSRHLGQFNISIDRIEHLNWRERYYLLKANDIAQIDLIYNSKGLITNIQPDINKCSSAELLNEISQAVLILQKK